jgi:hypothetical protein
LSGIENFLFVERSSEYVLRNFITNFRVFKRFFSQSTFWHKKCFLFIGFCVFKRREGDYKMNRFRSVFSIYLAVAIMVLGFISQADAQNNQNQREVRNIVQNLLSKIDDFRYSLDSELSRATINRSEKDDINNDVKGLENSINQFESKFQRGRESSDDVSDILNAAKSVNDFVNNRRYGNGFQTDWVNVRNLLDRLASAYKVNWNWNGNTSNNSTNYPNNFPTNTNTNTNVSYGLTGTYNLDSSRSENARDILDRAKVQNDADRADLESKLESAEQIAIDIRGNQVVLASSKSAPINFTADGRDRTEKTSDGRTVRTRATIRGQELTVSSLGGETDYTVTFASIDNGKSLKVTRRITTGYMNQTVFAESFYNKTDSVAQLGIDTNNNNSDVYSSSDSNDYPNNNSSNYPTTTTPRTGQFIVPNGTIITGTLDNDITTKVSQNNDRFKMTVNAPNEYRGAVIEGYISGINRSGKVSGRSQITFNFERMRLANGQNYDFAGFLQSITDTNGKTIKVGTEGEAKGDSQTKETVKRGGIGAGLGAIIGAIASGGKGAAIGAIIGGGAGAGSVILTGKEELDLKQGSSITVQSSSPNR